jgi:ABC-2 type transport system ATP-binding protein
MIEALELTKSFGAITAVRGVSFQVRRGEAVGFLGPNGAGKTTTFRMLAGTLAPSSGSVRVLDADLFESPILAKRQLGYMAENAPLYPELTGLRYLHFRAELRGVPRAERTQAVQLAASRAGATEILGQIIGQLSKGYRQRLALADALVGDPPVLLLDEPTAGLDPNQVIETRRLIKELSTDHAIILSTHVLSEVEATCHRAIVIDRGRVVGQGSLDELKRKRGQERASIEVLGSKGQLEAALLRLTEQGFGPTLRASHELNVLEIALPQADSLTRGVQLCLEAGLLLVHAGPRSAPLDEVFAQLTQEHEP